MDEPTVLVVDDDSEFLAAVTAFLQRRIPTSQVVAAPDGHAALQILEKRRADVVVCDYRMPGMDGLSLLEETRRLAPGAARILMTAYPDLQLALDALNKEHVAAFLLKPVPPDTLAQAVADALHNVRRDALRQVAFEEAARFVNDRWSERQAPGKPRQL